MTEKIGSFQTLFMRFGKNQPVFCGIGTSLSEIKRKELYRVKRIWIMKWLLIRNGYIGDVGQL